MVRETNTAPVRNDFDGAKAAVAAVLVPNHNRAWGRRMLSH